MPKIFYIIAIVVLTGCKNEQSRNQTLNDSKSAVSKETNVIKKSYTISIDTTTLLEQAQKYSRAIQTGDGETAWKHIYPDATKFSIEQWKEDYPFLNEEVAKKAYIKEMNIVREGNKHGIRLLIYNEKIKKIIIVDENTAIGVLSGDTKQYIQDNIKEEKEVLSVGITFDKGITWTFTSVGEDTHKILSMRFSTDIIDKVLDR